MHSKPRGRLFFAGPGPTNIPDSVLHAIGHVTVDFNDPDFVAVFDACVAGLKRVLRTRPRAVHVHRLRPRRLGGDARQPVLARRRDPDAGIRLFLRSLGGNGAQTFGLAVQTVAADWRRGVDLADVTAALRADPAARHPRGLRRAQRNLDRRDAAARPTSARPSTRPAIRRCC